MFLLLHLLILSQVCCVLMSKLLLFLIESSVCTSAPPRPRRYIAFGDWGHPTNIPGITVINEYLRSNMDYIDGVFLLGDNFYPDGIDPSLGVNDPKFDLFSKNLANGIPPGPLNFFPVLGNHDYMRGGQHAEIEYSKTDPRWIMPDNDFFVKFPLDDDDEDFGACVWFIDSVMFTDKNVRGLTKSIQEEYHNCVWKLVVSHYPAVTAGLYINDETVGEFYAKISCVLCRFEIDFMLSGHEHSSQVLHDPRIGGTTFLIAGAATHTYTGSLHRPTTTGSRASLHRSLEAALEWGDDVTTGVVLKLDFTKEWFKFEFVQLHADGTQKILFSDELAKETSERSSFEDLATRVERMCLEKCAARTQHNL